MRRRKDKRKKERELMVHYTRMFMYLAVALIVMSAIVAVIV
jgi:uncharacterized membrane protein YidH (DUF202 family)